ncbi:class I SAM-dependent methyltransferase [Nocardia sp. CS682]|uniref:class I SAM-dependent methyltransferase n=1 Tax=Nocardia sp. CS682 TaxID=1047172 RepID=UPI001074E571|nr:class I SAM-dependent methyltransferase [Nocardia sp. CS682]QBS45064.1 SAM-dependent methyltransferase [Nocardia sp. CS682]
METGQPSRTALATAYARAYHQVAPEPRVLTDPLAAAIAGVRAEELSEAAVAPPGESAADAALQRLRRLCLAARSRFAEDTIADAVADGVRQAVSLGAGLDTFAYRNPHAGLRVFEVDHPATQTWKRMRLAEAAIEVPGSLTFAPVDFETATLAQGLAAAGFARDEPAVFLWLGVVMYLAPDTVRGTLRYIAEHAAPVRVVADYIGPPSAAAPEYRAALAARAERVAALGEPWLSYFTAPEMAAELRAAGFTHIDDRNSADVLADFIGRAELGPDPDLLNSRIVRAGRT